MSKAKVDIYKEIGRVVAMHVHKTLEACIQKAKDKKETCNSEKEHGYIQAMIDGATALQTNKELYTDAFAEVIESEANLQYINICSATQKEDLRQRIDYAMGSIEGTLQGISCLLKDSMHQGTCAEYVLKDIKQLVMGAKVELEGIAYSKWLNTEGKFANTMTE